MPELPSRFWDVFFEVFQALPRQGPGNRECAVRALSLCQGLPPSSAILDMGCGVGGQTLYLAELTDATIVALDNRARFIEQLGHTLEARGLSHRVRPVVGDMAKPAFDAHSFDLIWSEGALYNVGIETALRVTRSLLKSSGFLAFTDAVWRKPNPPAEVRALFDEDYPEMGRAEDTLQRIDRGGFELLGHFTLPDNAWWDDFYTPMEKRIRELRYKYASDRQALDILDQLQQEIEMHRNFAEFYTYEFFVARRKG